MYKMLKTLFFYKKKLSIFTDIARNRRLLLRPFQKSPSIATPANTHRQPPAILVQSERRSRAEEDRRAAEVLQVRGSTQLDNRRHGSRHFAGSL